MAESQKAEAASQLERTKQAQVHCAVCGKAMNTIYAWIPCPKCGGRPACLAHCYTLCGLFDGSDCPQDADPIARYAAGQFAHPEVPIKTVNLKKKK